MHENLDITQIAVIVLTTLGFGLVFERFRQPAVLGYIIAGVFLSSLNLIEDRNLVKALAELGIIMLLYLVGLDLNINFFRRLWAPSLAVTLAQIIGSILVVLAIGFFFDIPLGVRLILACGIALSSTAVAIKTLESIGELRTDTGRLCVGILIAQDLMIVPMILLIRGGAASIFSGVVLFKILIAAAILTALVWYLSRKEKIALPFAHLFINHEDLQPLAGMFFCFGMAALSGLIDLSAAYGAFLGGLIVGNTSDRQSMIASTKPIQAVLMMVFFLSVGLLLDFSFLWHNIFKVSALLLFITIGKTVLNIGILHVLKNPWPRAFLAGLVLGQMGEFSFLLATIGHDVQLLRPQDMQLIISLAALSLTVSPLWVLAARRLHDTAPARIKSLHQLLETVYGPQVRLWETLCGKTKKPTGSSGAPQSPASSTDETPPNA